MPSRARSAPRLEALALALLLAGCVAGPDAGDAAPRDLPGSAIARAGLRVDVLDDGPRAPPEDGVARSLFRAGECRDVQVTLRLREGEPPVEAALAFEYQAEGGREGGLAAAFDPPALAVEPGGNATATARVCAAPGHEGERGSALFHARVEPEVGSVSSGLLTLIR